MSTSTAEAILSTIRHITAKKWDKAASRLDTIGHHLQVAESSLKYSSKTPDAHNLQADVLMLLDSVRKAFAGYLEIHVDGRSARTIRGGGHGSPLYRSGQTVSLKTRLEAIERMLWEAKYSSGFSKSAVLAWREELLSFLRQGHRRMTYTSLFGNLTNEWADLRFGELSSSKEKRKAQPPVHSEYGEATEVTVGRKEMYQQREIWEGHVATERKTDTDKITAFLDDLFHAGSQHKELAAGEPTDLCANFLRDIRKSIAQDCKRKLEVTAETVKAAVQGVLSADQLTSEKRRALLDISNKDNVLSEIADLLNIDTSLDSLNQWSWGETPITAQMRKAINGKYRVYLDLELLDAILIQCIGQSISVKIRDAILNSWSRDAEDVWQPPASEARFAAMERQIADIERRQNNDSVQTLRRCIYKNTFLAVSLPRSTVDTSRGYDDDGSVDSDDASPKFTDLANGPPNKFALRTDLLRLCSAEMAVQKLTQGQFCVLQSDFEWFGPSLPHSTLLAIMKYFHFPAELVHFVKEFLSMHMKFEEDGANGPIVTRKTGIPVSFQLTDGISELLLFVLDFAVNQKTTGSFLYRNHDDLWFWGQPEKCAVAWETICEFTEVMGLRLNKDKTGSAHAVDESNARYIPVDKSVIRRLPEGKLKWGFLSFDANEWKWTANKPAIKEHMGELHFQLKSRTAVMAHIQAYNAYIQNFLPNNFGPVFIGLGDSHPIMVLEALQYALQCLYAGGESDKDSDTERPAADAAEHVRRMIQSHFGEHYEVPDCFLYMDIENGGLGLANPVPAFAQYVDISHNKKSENGEGELPPMAEAQSRTMKNLSSRYREDIKKFTERRRGKKKGKKSEKVESMSEGETSTVRDALGKRLLNTSEFMSFSDYVATGEQHSNALYQLYLSLVEAPEIDSSSLQIKHWATDLFHDELETLFGGHIAEEEFLSLGLYRTLAEEKVRWEG